MIVAKDCSLLIFRKGGNLFPLTKLRPCPRPFGLPKFIINRRNPKPMSPKQSAQHTHDWNASNVLDDVDYQEHEARQFRDLLYGTEKSGGESTLSQLNAGQVL